MITAHEALEISNSMSNNDDIFDDITRVAYQGNTSLLLQWDFPTQQVEYFKALGYEVAVDLMAYQTTISWDKPV